MATRAELEEALRTRLAACLPGVPVSAFPDSPKAYRMRHPKAEVLVVFRGGDFELPKPSSGLMVQERTVRFELSLLVRSLGGHQGAYALLEDLQVALMGARIHPEARPLWIERDSFLDVTEGQWTWAMFVATKVLARPAPDAPPSPITQIRIETPAEPVEVP